MAYKQVKTPNFDPYIKQGSAILTSWLGWCMAYVEQSVGQFYQYGDARQGWAKVKGRHTGTPPKGVWIPLWYSGYYQQGHVLWAKFNSNGSGTAYTTPRTPNKATADKITFSSNADLTAQLKRGWASDIKYLGWSEYVGSQQIVKWVADPKPAKKPALVTGKRIARKGTATVIVAGLNVRSGPSKKHSVVAVYGPNETFKYDSYIITNGSVWLSYVASKSKERRYVSEGPYDGNSKNIYVKGGIS